MSLFIGVITTSMVEAAEEAKTARKDEKMKLSRERILAMFEDSKPSSDRETELAPAPKVELKKSVVVRQSVSDKILRNLENEIDVGRQQEAIGVMKSYLDFGDKCRSMVDTKLFQNFITCCILVAAALVGMQTYEDLEEDLHDFFIIADAIILAIFTVECALKLVAEGKRPQDYFKHAWNVFDFVVVFACYMPFGGSAVAVLRLLRLLRVLKLFNNIPELQIILSGLAKGMSSVSYIGLLMFLLFYVFGIISVQFFRCDPHP
jgi:hypothetical protein